MKSRILIVLSYFAPYISGISEYARLLAEGLSRFHEVTVLTGRHDTSLPSREERDGYVIVRAEPGLRVHKGYVSHDLARHFRKLACSVDVVNFHLPMLDAAWLCSLAPRRTFFLTTYQCDVQRVGGALDAIAIGAVNFASRRLLARSSKIFVLSKDYAAASPLLAPHESRWVEGFAPIKSTDTTDRDTWSRKGPLSEFRVGFLGRFVREKGIGVLADAIQQVIPRIPKVKLVLAGEHRVVAGGSVHSQLSEKLTALGPHLEMLGRLPENALNGFYRSLDVFVLPSVNAYEAFGMVQVEAMMHGTPVIASDMRGVRVPIQLTKSGYLVPPGDSSALAAAICNVAQADAFSRHQISMRAHKMFNNDLFLDRYVRAISDLVGGRVQE